MGIDETIPKVRARIAADQAEGFSMRESLAIYRGEGGRMRTDDYATLWRDEQRKAKRRAA